MITVELAVETIDWTKTKMRIPKNKIQQKSAMVKLILGEKLKHLSGIGTKKRKCGRHVQALGLIDRIVTDF